jgi:hypothetical protein
MRKLVVLLGIMALVFSGAAVAGAKGGKAKAKATATSGVAYAGVSHAEGKDLYVSGDFVDKVLGHGAIVYITNVSAGEQQGEFRVDARKITIYTSKGTFVGKGGATQVIHEDGSVEVKDGTFALTKGTGKYKGHTFKGTFAGPQSAQGLYTFTYKGVIK